MEKGEKVMELDQLLDMDTAEAVNTFAGHAGVNDDMRVTRLKGTRTTERMPELSSATSAMNKMGRTRTEHYLNSSPGFKTIETQIRLLNMEAKQYSRVNPELHSKCIKMISELTKQRKDFMKVLSKPTGGTELGDKIRNSGKLKEMKAKRDALEKEFRFTNPSSVLFLVREYRGVLGLSALVDEDTENFIDLDSDDDDDMLKQLEKASETTNVRAAYDRLMAHIYDNLIDKKYHDVMSISQFYTMNTSKIGQLLRENVDVVKIDKLKLDIETVKFEASNEMSTLSGKHDITNVMYEIFDYNTVREEEPKEMLAANHIELVNKIAYDICSRQNLIQYVNDASGYGFLGLSLALDKWYKIQKTKDNPVSFQGFANVYISNEIRKGLYEIARTGGTISRNAMADMVHKQQKSIKIFMNANPELRDLPVDLMNDISDNIHEVKPIPSVKTESEYTGDDGEYDSDVWNNIHRVNDNELIEARVEYEEYLKSLKDLFNLFKTRVNPNSGEREVTNMKIFDKYDYKLFKLMTGIEFKVISVDGDSKKFAYNNREIGEILTRYYHENGEKGRKLIDGDQVWDMIQRLSKKMKAAVDQYPGIKAGLSYLLTYTGTEINTRLNHEREEIEKRLRKPLIESNMNNMTTILISRDLSDEEIRLLLNNR